jgi:hypothetical protein
VPIIEEQRYGTRRSGPEIGGLLGRRGMPTDSETKPEKSRHGNEMLHVPSESIEIKTLLWNTQ